MPAADDDGWVQFEFGDQIGQHNRYTIARKLGSGMHSSTWLARDMSVYCQLSYCSRTSAKPSGAVSFCVTKGYVCGDRCYGSLWRAQRHSNRTVLLMDGDELPRFDSDNKFVAVKVLTGYMTSLVGCSVVCEAEVLRLVSRPPIPSHCV